MATYPPSERRVQPPAAAAAPTMTFLARVALRLDSVRVIREAPDGVRLEFMVHGTVEGPVLKGQFPTCAAYLLIDRDGIGTIDVRAAIVLHDGADAELEATGRYDFGPDGYRRALADDLPNSALGWCPRFLTGHPRYAWLNRTLCLGVGELRPREGRVDYDLFALAAPVSTQASLYDRLGGRPQIDRIVSEFIDALFANTQLNTQNPKVAAGHARVDIRQLKSKVGDVFSELAGGPKRYQGRSMRMVHAPLDITDADWDIAAAVFAEALLRLGVPNPERDELLAAVGSTKADIVTRR